MSRSRKHSLKSSLYYADQEKCCFHLEMFGLRHLRGGLFRSLLLQHGNEVGTKTTCFHRNDYIEYIKTYQLYYVDCPESSKLINDR